MTTTALCLAALFGLITFVYQYMSKNPRAVSTAILAALAWFFRYLYGVQL